MTDAMPHAVLRVDGKDNVLVALREIREGERISSEVIAADVVPAGHKLAACDIRAGTPVMKFGYPIGIASTDIRAGEHVHTHNVRSALVERVSAMTPTHTVDMFAKPAAQSLTFDGYVRPGGAVGTRNEIWIVNTVGCVNQASQRIAAEAGRRFATPGSGIDGVHAFPHPFGCSQLGDDLYHTQLVLAGLANHPNAAGVLVLGLGCENNQLRFMLDQIGDASAGRLRYFNAQDVNDEVEAGVESVGELVEIARSFRREAVPASRLIVGMKCGGSDGFSGVTANPLVGRVADALSAAGATVLLTEVPEMFGAEEVLMSRCAGSGTAEGVATLVNNFRDYFRRYGQPVDENPSPGNKAGGITTLAEKSLGCVQKGGRAPVRSVLSYAAPAPWGLGGIALLNAPGNDGVSSTAMTVAGAGVLLFTTGRGTPMGFPVPTLKISSNSPLARRKPNWIDFDAGPIADGLATHDDLAADLLRLVLDTASGRTRAKNELNDHREIAIWKDGVTL